MKKILVLLALLVFQQAFAQVSPHPYKGTISTAGSDCSTATRCVTVTIPPETASATITVDADTGSWSGTIQFEGTTDGTHWIAMVPTSNSSSTASSTTATGVWQFNPSSYIKLRARGSARVSGTAPIVINWSNATASNGGGGGSGSGTVLTGTATDIYCNSGSTTTTAPCSTGVATIDTSGNAAVRSLVASVSIGVGTAPTACGSATGCFAATAASTASTQTSGQGSIRLDSSSGNWLLRESNGAAEYRIAIGNYLATFTGMSAARTYTGTDADAYFGSVTETGTSVSLKPPAEIYVCSSTCTVTPPVPVAGYQFCVFNGDNVATVITLAALGSSARYEATARTGYGTAGTGTFVSGGAVKDSVCIVGLDSTHYLTTNYNGTWVAN